MIEESSVFTFKSGTMIGDNIEDDHYDLEVIKKTSTLLSEQHGDNKIGKFCLRPYLIPLSSLKVKITIVAFPLTPTELENQHPHSNKVAFP